jgi:hypothetical protein
VLQHFRCPPHLLIRFWKEVIPPATCVAQARTPQLPPYLLDLGPADIFLFPKVKRELAGRRARGSTWHISEQAGPRYLTRLNWQRPNWPTRVAEVVAAASCEPTLKIGDKQAARDRLHDLRICSVSYPYSFYSNSDPGEDFNADPRYPGSRRTRLKATVARDFRPLAFFHQSNPLESLMYFLKYFRIRIRIRRTIELLILPQVITICYIHIAVAGQSWPPRV